MIWLSIFALLLRILFLRHFDLSLMIPKILQTTCNHWIDDYYLMPVFSGLVCGTELPEPQKNLFLQIGLFHWFVASGGHLVFLQLLLHKIRLRHFGITFLALVLFSLVCGFQPPMARALMGVILSWLTTRWSLFLRTHHVTLLAGLWTLLLFPQWYNSFSLQLSWLVALALPWSPKHLVQSLAVSLTLAPLSSHWSALHLLYNFLFTPIFASVLFPLTLLTFLLAPLTLIGNQIWSVIIELAQWLPKDANPLQLPSPWVCWLYILAIHVAHIFFGRLKNV